MAGSSLMSTFSGIHLMKRTLMNLGPNKLLLSRYIKIYAKPSYQTLQLQADDVHPFAASSERRTDLRKGRQRIRQLLVKARYPPRLARSCQRSTGNTIL